MVHLPPAVVKSATDAAQVALRPSLERIGAGLLALTEAVIRGHSKSREEMLLDVVEAGMAASDRKTAAIQRLRQIANDPNPEYQRILAREAVRFVPLDRFIMPATPIAGRIFRDSEFEDEGSPIWAMWAQLLARACDKDRVGEAHPSFPWLITQLSGDEAKLLEALAPIYPRASPLNALETATIPSISTSDIGMVFPTNLNFYLNHLGSLGLTVLPMGWQPTAHVVMVDESMTYMLTDFGRAFMAAVTEPVGGV